MSSVFINPNSAAPITLLEPVPGKSDQTVGHQHVALNPPLQGRHAAAPVSSAAVVDISADALAAAKA